MALRQSKIAVIRGKIAGYMKMYGQGADEMAAKMRMSPATWYRRVSDPGKFTVKELERLEFVTGLEIIGGGNDKHNY